MILACYPDFGKAPPEYAVNLIDVLATYPEKMLVKFCDLRTGIAARCRYLPTIADIVEAGEAIEKAENLAVWEREWYEKAVEKEALAAKFAEERAEFEAAQKAKLIEARKKHPTAYLNKNFELGYFPELECEGKLPTQAQIDFAVRQAR